MPSSAAPVFVSYNHKDKGWLKRVLPFLRPLRREGLIDPWDDTRIRAGEQWREEIQGALQAAKVAILLVSQDFLDSDFIQQHELPPLLEKAQARGLTILWVPLCHSTYKHTVLEKYQAVSDPGAPLDSLKKSQVNQVFVQLHECIREIVGEPVSPGAKEKSIFLVPFEENQAFTGREEVLAEIDRTLLQNGTGALSQTAGIAGLGGVGKTQTAVEYAYRHRYQYTAVLWVVAESESTLTSGYAEIARRLGLADATEQKQTMVRDAVKGWLEQHEDWLLVFDNADTPGLVKPYLPRQHHGCVLLTSRAHTLQELGVLDAVHLDTLTPPEAYAFLLTRTKRDAATLSKEERSAAEKLAEELGYLPLALEQAAAYLVQKKAGFSAYLTSYRKRRLQLLEASKPLLGECKDSVATTWLLNFAEVEKTPASADLLRLSAFLAPDEIPLDLLAQGATEIGGPLGEQLSQTAEDPLVLDELLDPLLRYSLVKREPGSLSFSVHRLIQTVLQDQLGEEEGQLWAERAVAVLDAVFPFFTQAFFTSVKLHACKRLVVHVQTVWGYIEQWQLKSDQASHLLNQTGIYLNAQSESRAAEPLLRRALKICEEVLGPTHPNTETVQGNLCYLLGI